MAGQTRDDTPDEQAFTFYYLGFFALVISTGYVGRCRSRERLASSGSGFAALSRRLT